MNTTELEPTTFLDGMSKAKEKSNDIYDQVKGAECNLKTMGRPIIQLTISKSQYNLIMSALSGTTKDNAAGVSRLLALELNSQLIKHQIGLADTLNRINNSIEENLEPELANKWKVMKDRKSSKKAKRKELNNEDTSE